MRGRQTDDWQSGPTDMGFWGGLNWNKKEIVEILKHIFKIKNLLPTRSKPDVPSS